jgi:hypothetical protein
MAKVRDFIMRVGQGWDVQLYNNSQSGNLPGQGWQDTMAECVPAQPI